MKNFLFLTIILSSFYLVISCKSPSDSISLPSNAAIEANARIGTLLQANLVDASIISDYELKAGILHFRDLDSYLKKRDELRKLSTQERISKTSFSGFTSLLSLYVKYFEAKEKGQDVNLFNDIAKQVGENKKIEILNTDFVASALLNRSGLVYIGKILYRFTDKQQEIIASGDQSKIGTDDPDVIKFDNVTTQVRGQGRLSDADFCRSSWTTKQNGDGERRISLDVKMKQSNYYTGTQCNQSGTFCPVIYKIECQPTAFGVPDKKSYSWDGSWEWSNYRTTNHLYSNWNFSAARADNGLVQSAIDNYEYWNYWNWIDYGGTILTFNDVPFQYYSNGNLYTNQMIPNFQFGGGFYYTDGVPEQLLMKCP